MEPKRNKQGAKKRSFLNKLFSSSSLLVRRDFSPKWREQRDTNVFYLLNYDVGKNVVVPNKPACVPLMLRMQGTRAPLFEQPNSGLRES